jgi:hypothetical protein
MKRVAKGLLLFIGSTTYVWLLFLSAGAFELKQTFSSPHTLKAWLADSGVYGGVIEEVSKLATIQQKQENSLVQITSDDIVQVAKDSFTSDSVKADAESTIDSFYDWFKGNTGSPEFRIDFTTRQAAFAKEMTDKLEEKIGALPECATTGRFSVQAFDPFEAECRPKGADVTAELTSFEKDLAVSNDILPQRIFTDGDVKLKDASGQETGIGTALAWMPRAYKALIWGPWLLSVLTVVAALSLIFFSSTKRKGLKRFANGLVFVGVIMLASGFLLKPAFDKLNNWSSKSLGAEASFTENVINPLFSEVSSTYAKYNIVIGTAYLIPAIITYGALIMTRHKASDEEPNEESEGAAMETQTSGHEPVQTEEAHIESEITEVGDGAPTEAVTTPPVGLQPQYQPPQQPLRPITRPVARPVTRRPPMIQG